MTRHGPTRAAIAATLALSLAACKGMPMGGQSAADSPADNLQAQMFALEASHQENRRLMGQVLSQNAQLRGDLATALEEGRALRQRVDTMERRLAQAPAPTEPLEAAEPRPAAEPRRTPVAVRKPASGARKELLRLDVGVRAGDGWRSLYANGEDRSQKVRIRRVSDGAPASIKLAATGTAAASGGPPQPSWDLPEKGAEKWLRIGCGQEVSARAEGEADFEVLVRTDQEPDLCPARSLSEP